MGVMEQAGAREGCEINEVHEVRSTYRSTGVPGRTANGARGAWCGSTGVQTQAEAARATGRLTVTGVVQAHKHAFCHWMCRVAAAYLRSKPSPYALVQWAGSGLVGDMRNTPWLAASPS